MTLQSCNDIGSIFECFPLRNKQTPHLNICPCTSVKSIRLLICTYRRWISAVAWHSYVYARHCIRFTPCARLSVPIYQMISNPQGFNPGHDTLQLVGLGQWWWPLSWPLSGSQLPALIIWTVPYPTGWPLCCFFKSSYCFLVCSSLDS